MNNWVCSMKINEILDGIKTQLKTQFPELKTCEIHDGRFDVSELKRVSTKTPAMHISVLGLPMSSDQSTEEVNVDASLVIYVITSDQPKLSKGESARNLVEALIPTVSHQRWGVMQTGKAESINAQNLFNSTANHGIALWAVTWRQNLTIGSEPEQESFMPAELYVDGVQINE
ncbi:MAG: hypothetical protein HWE39_12800 [Oceanospirillaceae bacterium]|nr:hypothetical protein [Oceanospirillaceae bacterium]